MAEDGENLETKLNPKFWHKANTKRKKRNNKGFWPNKLEYMNDWVIENFF